MTKPYHSYRHVRLSRPHAAIKPGRSTRIATVNALLLGQSHEVFRQRSRRRATRKSFAGSSYQDDLMGKNHTATKFSINSQFVVSYENLVFVSRRLSYGWFSQGRSAQMPSAELAFERIHACHAMRISNADRTAAGRKRKSPCGMSISRAHRVRSCPTSNRAAPCGAWARSCA